MGDRPHPQSGPVAAAAAVEAVPPYVADVLASRTFERAPTLRTLLLYLWQHRGESLSEYAVATEALGRSDNFSSKVDATVRVQISRLRQRLEKYYEDEGHAARERLIIPLGSHQVEVRESEDAGAAAVAAAAAPLPARARLVPVLIAVCGVLCLALALSAFRLNDPVAPAKPVAPRFWKAFFGNSRPTRIILPTPIFFAWATDTQLHSLMVRDTEINQFDMAPDSQNLRALQQRYGPPALSQSYTVTSDTFASVQLARYLDRLSFDTNVMSSASAPLDALDRENVIALGTWGTLTPLKPYLDKMSFELSRHETLVTNRAPEGGEPATLEYRRLSQERAIWPGVIAVLPGRENRTRLLILAGRHTSALVSLLTSREGQDQLDRLWKSKGSPEFFDVVVEAEMNGEILVRYTARMLHRFEVKPGA